MKEEYMWLWQIELNAKDAWSTLYVYEPFVGSQIQKIQMSNMKKWYESTRPFWDLKCQVKNSNY